MYLHHDGEQRPSLILEQFLRTRPTKRRHIIFYPIAHQHQFLFKEQSCNHILYANGGGDWRFQLKVKKGK
jgi:hypothetical protein